MNCSVCHKPHPSPHMRFGGLIIGLLNYSMQKGSLRIWHLWWLPCLSLSKMPSRHLSNHIGGSTTIYQSQTQAQNQIRSTASSKFKFKKTPTKIRMCLGFVRSIST